MIAEKLDITVLAFGIAKEILGKSSIQFKVEEGEHVGGLKQKLTRAYPEFQKLVSFSVAVNQEYQEDNFILSANDEVAIIPPVSGG